MSHETWSAIDEFLAEHVVGTDEPLEAALRDSDEAGLPAISVTAPQGKFLMLLAQMIGANAILEIGTLGGFSTIWLARGLARGGRVVTLEYEPRHAEVAARNLERAGLSDRVEIRIGAAIETLPKLAEERLPPFDLVFIDADKKNTCEYFEWALRLTHPGSVIVVDNVVRSGGILDGSSDDEAIQAMRRLFARLQSDPRVTATALQTVGGKGYDGFVLARVE